MDDAAAWLAALDRASIIADPRKFRDYVLVPGHPTGKDRIFLGTLGFRPRNSVDAWALARLYEEQARARVSSGDVLIAGRTPHGVRCTILIAVRGLAVRSGWLLRVDDVLWLVTPFSGFAAREKEWEG